MPKIGRLLYNMRRSRLLGFFLNFFFNSFTNKVLYSAGCNALLPFAGINSQIR